MVNLYPMTYPSLLLVMLCIKWQLSEEAYRVLAEDLKAHGSFQFKTMVAIIAHHFDIEQLAHQPKDFWRPWVYNYIMFRQVKFFKMKEVIALYEVAYAPSEVSKYELHMCYKELMDLIRYISPKPKKVKAIKPTKQLSMFTY